MPSRSASTYGLVSTRQYPNLSPWRRRLRTGSSPLRWRGGRLRRLRNTASTRATSQTASAAQARGPHDSAAQHLPRRLLMTMSRAMARKVLGSLKTLLRDAQRRGTSPRMSPWPSRRSMPTSAAKAGSRWGSTFQPRMRSRRSSPRPGIGDLLLTAIFTGLRASELRGLRWSDVDLKTGELTVRQRADRYNVIGKPKSKAGNRTVPLGPLVLNVLREWKLACPKGGCTSYSRQRAGRSQATTTSCAHSTRRCVRPD